MTWNHAMRIQIPPVGAVGPGDPRQTAKSVDAIVQLRDATKNTMLGNFLKKIAFSLY